MLYFKITLLFAHMDLTMLQVVGNHDLDFWAILLKSHSRTWKRWITWKKFTSLPDGLGQFTHATIPSSTTHVIHEPCIRPCSPRVLRSSVVRASDRCRKGHRFNSCWGLRFFLCPVHVKCWSYYSRGSFYCKGVITWHRGDFRACASSLRFPLMALYLFTRYHHNMSCRRELPWRELIPETPVRIATLSCKRETTTRFGVKSICRWTGTGSAYVRFAILNRTCLLSTWSVPSNNRDMKWPIIM